MNCSHCNQHLPNRIKIVMRLDKHSSGGYQCPHCSHDLVSRFQLYRFRLLSIVTMLVIILSATQLIGQYLYIYPLTSDLQLLYLALVVCLIGLLIFAIILLRLPINKPETSWTKNSFFFLGVFLLLLSLIVLTLGSFTEDSVVATVGEILFVGSLLWVHVFY